MMRLSKICAAHSHGIALLYALLLTTVLLTSFLILSSISYRQIVTAGTYRDGIMAYRVALNAVNCAQVWERYYQLTTPSTHLYDHSGESMSCQGFFVVINLVGGFSDWWQVVIPPPSGFTEGPCSIVFIHKEGDGSVTYKVGGYNLGNISCNSTNLRRVLRIIKL